MALTNINIPGGHVCHEVHPVWLGKILKSSSSHGPHIRSVDDEPIDLKYVPARHPENGVHVVVFPNGENDPSGHEEHVISDVVFPSNEIYWPAEHSM